MRRHTLITHALTLALFSLSALQSFSLSAPGAPRRHPCLVLTPAEQGVIKQNLGKYPLFDAAYRRAVAAVDTALANPIDVPAPKDAAGYTHERHKRNYAEMQAAGFLYQITGDKKYFNFVKTHLDRYAALYPMLGAHPAAKEQSAGKIFWQSLNETVWLVNVSQAYDCVYDDLAPADRARYEQNLFRPMVTFLTETRGNELDRIHNHGTWTAAAIGMIGCVMDDDILVKKALHGSRMDGSAGFLRQIDLLFSPDGYYCEGPYYARYALMPFFLFAQVIQNNHPELKIFDHRDCLLVKALDATLQQSWLNGEFLPINDSLKDKSWRSSEIVLALDLAYAQMRNPGLLPVARIQNTVALNAAGLEVAKALAQSDSQTPAPPPARYPYRSIAFTDGPDGKRGGLAILRSGPDPGRDTLVALKYTAFGMEHGHFDKLSIIHYAGGRENLQDYGAARFLNVEQKTGGRYLPENRSYARQTIAHNTVTIDEKSQYGGAYKKNAPEPHSNLHFANFDDPDFQVASATDTTAYPGVAMQRTTAIVRDARLEHPVVIDIYRLVSEKTHRYDCAFHYQGVFLATNATLTHHTKTLSPLGAANGYQHLWLLADGPAKPGTLQFTWMNGQRFHTLHTASDENTKLLHTQIGANDPNLNLRPDRAIIIRRDGAATHTFATAIEPHGDWDGVTEITHGCMPCLQKIEILASTAEGAVIRVTGANNLRWTICVTNRPSAPDASHTIIAGDNETFTWRGDAALEKG
ncbi:MAG: heparinase II/III family protein [Opitutaceae bacterium]|jgi:hypothetical protein|nr:heparinase II/III family protein [Opitutaceae bacterium]